MAPVGTSQSRVLCVPAARRSFPPRVILVPTDLEDSAEVALDYALSLANSVDARVYLVHALVAPFSSTSTAPWAVQRRVVDCARREARERLEAIGQRRNCGLDRLSVQVMLGDPCSAIVAAAEELDADLICIGAHRRRGLDWLLPHHLAAYVAEHSPVPLLVVH